MQVSQLVVNLITVWGPLWAFALGIAVLVYMWGPGIVKSYAAMLREMTAALNQASLALTANTAAIQQHASTAALMSDIVDKLIEQMAEASASCPMRVSPPPKPTAQVINIHSPAPAQDAGKSLVNGIRAAQGGGTSVTITTSIMLALLATIGLALPAHADASPTLQPFKKAIDYRRNPAVDTEQNPGWTNPVDITPTSVISLTTPVSGTVGAQWTLGPVTDPSGTKCLFWVKENGTGSFDNGTNSTAGTGWTKNLLRGYLQPAANDSTPRWLAMQAYCPTGRHAQTTVSWQTMVAQ